MSDYAVTINLPHHKRGDRWGSYDETGIAAPITIGPITINGASPVNALARIRMHLRLRGETYRLDSDPTALPDAPITIDDAATWTAHIPPIEDFLPYSGDWSWDMEFYEDGTDSPLTFYKGTLTVIADVTI